MHSQTFCPRAPVLAGSDTVDIQLPEIPPNMEDMDMWTVTCRQYQKRCYLKNLSYYLT